MFTLTVSNETKKMMELLEIKECPFTFDELQKSYRIALKLNHPDICKDKDAAKKTSKIIAAYKHLKNISVDKKEERRQEEGMDTKFKNIIKEPCPHCNDGMTYQPGGRSICFSCYGRGYKKIDACRACKGSGRFTQARSKKVVPCRRCEGTGIWKQTCRTCEGKGIWIEPEKWYKCHYCNGKGYKVKEVLNPVFGENSIV